MGPGQGPPGPQTPAELNAGMNPTLMRAMKHRPPEDWTGLRLRMDYTSPDNGKILVIGISRRHPAYRAGVRDGDVVQSINGVKPNDLEEAFEMLSNVQPGTGAVVAIQRGGFSGTMTLERPRSEP